MLPYPNEALYDAKRIFGYRLSRARRTLENVFGICSSRFHVLQIPIIGDVKNVISITKVVVSLHNYLINETRYISRPLEEGMGGDQNLQESFLSSEKLAGITQLKGHSKSTFVVQGGEGDP